MTEQKSITIAFLGNANYDTRVTNLTKSLTEEGFVVKVISFDWTTAEFKDILGHTSIYKLDKSKGSLSYYLNFMRILFHGLKNSKSSIYIAEDIYTLPLVTIFAKIRKAKLYYNSREFYAFLGGLRDRKMLQNTIRWIEKYFIKKVNGVLVTGEGDAQFLQEYYGINNTFVIRNLPLLKKPNKKVDLRTKLNIPPADKILLYQGVILQGRGFQPMLRALTELENLHLIVLGSGPFQIEYEKLAEEIKVNNRVHFLGTIDQNELINYTADADLGLALIENISKSYYYALPNKLFEYIMAEVPVICSNLPQMKKIVDEYNVGRVVDLENSHDLTENIKAVFEDVRELQRFKENCRSATTELNWEKEFEKVKFLFVG